MPSIVVSGAIANKLFNGGAAWTRLNYLLGFQKLGFDAYFIEQIQPENCVDEAEKPASFECSANRSYFRRITEQFGLSGRTALIDTTTQQTEGLSYSDVLEITNSAALLVNISG